MSLTKFEKAKIIGVRATQISRGAKPQVDITGLDDSYRIAEREFLEGKIPLIIKRKYPKERIEEIGINKTET